MFSFLNLEENKPLKFSLLIYIFSIIFIYIFKPDICFNDNGENKDWGTGNDKTLFHFIIICFLISLFSYLILNILY